MNNRKAAVEALKEAQKNFRQGRDNEANFALGLANFNMMLHLEGQLAEMEANFVGE